mgnify:CR=1 FL=1
MALTYQGIFGRTLFKNEARNRGVFGRTKFYVGSNVRGIFGRVLFKNEWRDRGVFGRALFHTDIHLWHPEDKAGVGRLDSVNDWKEPWWFDNDPTWCDNGSFCQAGIDWQADNPQEFNPGGANWGLDNSFVFSGQADYVCGTAAWTPNSAEDANIGNEAWKIRQTLFTQGIFGRVNFIT